MDVNARPSGTDAEEVKRLLDRVRSQGSPGLSEHKEARIGGRSDTREASVRIAGRLVGYAQAAWHGGAPNAAEGHWAVEILVDPEASPGTEVVGQLLKNLRQQLPVRDPVAVWALDEPLSEILASLGHPRDRRLLELERTLPLEADAALPDSVVLRPFIPGRDDAAWLELNNRAFAGHPENGTLDQGDLDERTARSWFDPAGFLLAWEGGRLVGFCWTKVHDDGTGEIYIVGVDPAARGRGLGRALVVAGAKHVHAAGAPSIMLYVDEDNRAAVGLYEALGFERRSSAVRFVG